MAASSAGEAPPSTWTRTRRGDACVLTFSNPPLGTIRHRDVEELDRLLGEAAARGERFVVLTGSGDVFVRHADLDDLLAMSHDEPTSGDPLAWIRALRALDRGPFVTIAAINGMAWGGGLEIALSCNLRVAADSATLAFPEVALGILPGVAAHRAVSALPEGRLIELLATGRPLPASEALMWGLVSDCVPAEQVVDAAIELCGAMSAHDHESVLAARDLVLDSRDLDERGRRRLQSRQWTRLAGRPVARARTRKVRDAYAVGTDSRQAFGLTDWTPWSLRKGPDHTGG